MLSITSQWHDPEISTFFVIRAYYKKMMHDKTYCALVLSWSILLFTGHRRKTGPGKAENMEIRISVFYCCHSARWLDESKPVGYEKFPSSSALYHGRRKLPSIYPRTSCLGIRYAWTRPRRNVCHLFGLSHAGYRVWHGYIFFSEVAGAAPVPLRLSWGGVAAGQPVTRRPLPFKKFMLIPHFLHGDSS